MPIVLRTSAELTSYSFSKNITRRCHGNRITMKIINSFDSVSDEFKGAVATIGNFDGVHLGHQQIFRKVVEEARQYQSKAVVITFDPHPKSVLHPEKRPFYLLTTLEEKLKLIESLQIDAVMLIPFSLEFSKTTAKDFVCGILWEQLRIRKIFIGHDYTFGRGKEGSEEYLTRFGKKLGFQVDVTNAVKVGEIVISSTQIRNSICEGDVKTAGALLGRPYNVKGRVTEGYRRGIGLGFPTANLEPEKDLLPPEGVYAVIAERKGTRHQGVLNIGHNPTFENQDQTVELHILDFSADLYREELEIFFIDRIRGEIRFDGPESLANRIRQDVARARDILKPHVS
ncbi:MAG: Riboflavin biosynthesis protein RibF [Syntrophus sp. PtaU1.Bin005]|nr:MAG: Riboflavin biosynthesis protein RibF [Syntrophus sp. PtaB.Bin138]OPY83596.1 MAG: Riboflavin biosynthesis protein RibF [Syntrophus sp. PtaU1.Bin005]